MIDRRIALSVLAGMAVMSCQQKLDPQVNDTEDMVHDTLFVYKTPTPIFGRLGEDSGMSAWQLLTDDGDTIELTLQDERTGQYAVLNGDLRNYTDRFAVFVNEDSTAVMMAINMTQLGKR